MSRPKEMAVEAFVKRVARPMPALLLNLLTKEIAQMTEPTTITTMRKPGTFLRFANWVSEAMGRPTNIIFWAVLVAIWTCIFAFGGSHLASGTWLPAWFTSQGFNFPLNLITTVAELFIGFLVAAAANRAQAALTQLLDNIEMSLTNDEKMEANLAKLMQVDIDVTQQVHELTKQVHALLANPAVPPAS